MPASSLSLRLSATALGLTRGVARLFLAIACVCAVGPSTAQAPPLQWGFGRKPQTMASSLDEVLDKLRTDHGLMKQFHEAYGREMDGAGILAAISTYERSLLTPGCRFDLWLGGDASAITAEELAGYGLFKSLGCVSCHQGVNVGGNMYQRHGIFHPLASPEPEIVRVPSLRNVAVTAPYFHDGSAPTLSQAVKAMGYAQLDRVLTDDQTNAIVAFLNTLTGTYRGRPVTPAAGSSQKAALP